MTNSIDALPTTVPLIKCLVMLQQPEIIQGLVSTSKEDGYVMMNLIESAPVNFGKNKKYYGVAGNLVAFVCRLSKEYGFDGEMLFFSDRALRKNITFNIDYYGNY